MPGSGFSLCPGGPWGQACEGHIPFAGAIKVAEQLTVGWETTWLGLTWPHGPRGQVCRRGSLLLRGRGHVEGAHKGPTPTDCQET